MGYYSDIAIGMSEQSFQNLWEKEKEFVDVEEGSILDMMTEFVDRSDDTVILIWKGFKWYGPLVARIEQFLSELSDCGDNSYYFLRIGEDTEDIEEYYVVGKNEPIITGVRLSREISIDSAIGDIYRFSPKMQNLRNIN